MSHSVEKPTVRSLAATLALIWLGCAVYVLLHEISGLLTLRDAEFNPLGHLVGLTLFYWLPWVALAPFAALCSARFPIRPERWRRPVAAHLGTLLVLALVHASGIGLLFHYSAAFGEMATYAPWQHTGHFLFGDTMLLFDTVFYAVIAATLNIRNFQQIVRQQELDAARLNEHLAELRFQTLRMQVDPHFLFNALNAIAVLLRKRDTARAVEMIGRLARFFRRTLERSSEQWVALEEELAMIDEYIGIAKIRFGERLAVEQQCDARVQRVAVPAMLLQPLVENALVHGLGAKVGECALAVECRADGDRLRIENRDDGAGCAFYADPNFRYGEGLRNVRARLAQMYGEDHRFTIDSVPDEGTRITIDLPRIPAAPERLAV